MSEILVLDHFSLYLHTHHVHPSEGKREKEGNNRKNKWTTKVERVHIARGQLKMGI